MAKKEEAMYAYGFALIAATLWGTAVFCEKMGLRGLTDPMAGLWARCIGVLTGGIILTFFIPQLSGKLVQMGWKSFLWILAGGAMASVLAQVFFYRALKFGEVGRVAAIGGAYPLFAFLLSILFLNETPTPQKVMGAVLVVAGVTLLK